MDSYGTVLDDLMGNLFEIVHVTVFYVGLSALMIGVVLSFLGSRRGDRSLLGYAIGTGGGFLLLLYYGYDILFGLLRWTFKVGTW
ncbi:putative membrane protein [Halorubrum sp. AJ67]|nr:putative membrane protein [Halorubrum sp. AJ67]